MALLRLDEYARAPRRVYVDVVNYAGHRFEAMAIQSYLDYMVEWWCPVCHEAKIAWIDQSVMVSDDMGNLNVQHSADCPVCGCDVEVKLV